jgi:hypothetical protein
MSEQVRYHGVPIVGVECHDLGSRERESARSCAKTFHGIAGYAEDAWTRLLSVEHTRRDHEVEEYQVRCVIVPRLVRHPRGEVEYVSCSVRAATLAAAFDILEGRIASAGSACLERMRG